MVAAQGAFKQSIPVVTVYTNLGQEAVRHSLEVGLMVSAVSRGIGNPDADASSPSPW
jgi:hypothetical protein